MMTGSAPAFAPLPHPETLDGSPRLTGVEIEFAGLTEDETAQLIQTRLGGQISRDGPNALRVRHTDLGEIRIVLDTALRSLADNAIIAAGLEALRGLIPVEIVTDPLDRDGLIRLDQFCDALRAAGAIGTTDGVLLGFGVHLNVAVVGARDPATWQTVLTFGLTEGWLRRVIPIDATRRLMPFVEPWPQIFVTELVQAASKPDFDVLRRLYARHCNSRNHALDLLPMLMDDDPQTFERLFPGQTNTKARPAFHYRLPDCRIDDADWSLNREWQRWRLVERLAADPDRLSPLVATRLNWDHMPPSDRPEWEDLVAEHLGPATTALGE